MSGSNIIQTIPTPSAILDIHFAPPNGQAGIFGVATSTGSIDMYQLDVKHGQKPEITHLRTLQFCPESVLVTAFSWHPRGDVVGMTLSDGHVRLGKVVLQDAEHKTTSGDVVTHDLEAWTLAFLPDGLGILSGGDDSTLRFMELDSNLECHLDDSAPGESSAAQKLPWVDRKTHTAGVTAILPLQVNEDGLLVLTGSYDDHIRLLYAPSIGRRSVLAELNLGGGVWRLKLLGCRPGCSALPGQALPQEILLLASCMHAGSRILRLRREGDEDWQFEVLASFEEHKSMNYGSDFQPLLGSANQTTFITTSFYDRLLCLWRF